MINTKDLAKILKKITILYVEDDDKTREDISETLQKFTNNLLVASNGKIAFELCQTHIVHLIITDINMPCMDGISFVTKVRESNKTLSIVMLTAYNSHEYLLKCVNLNIQAYIMKPINYEKLKEALYNVVEYLNLTSNIHIDITNNLSYDTINGLLIIDKTTEINLNKKEKALMDLLINHKNNLVTYSQIEQNIWNNYDEIMTNSALRTVVKNLRKKSDIKFIENISGQGYKLITL